MTLPDWHESGLAAGDVVHLGDIAALATDLQPAALRSYATRRRTSRKYGPMPEPVATLSNRRLWLRVDIERWLQLHLPPWQRRSARQG